MSYFPVCRDNFGGITGDINGADSIEKKQQKLIYHLNTSGKYFAFKEQLKHSIVKIVREKYLRTVNFKDKNELQVGSVGCTLLYDFAKYKKNRIQCDISQVIVISVDVYIRKISLTNVIQLRAHLCHFV